MKVLGFRCSSNDYTYAIMSGSQASPIVEKINTISFPKGYSRQQELKWFIQEVEVILEDDGIRVICIKGTEPMAARNKPFVARVENETIIYLATANKGIKRIYKKLNSTIAKDFGFKGKKKYLEEIETENIPGYRSFTTKKKEAVLVAWSTLR